MLLVFSQYTEVGHFDESEKSISDKHTHVWVNYLIF